MPSINKVILIGHLGKDPEARHTQDGKPVVNLSLATSESWRDKESGERKERTEWHRVTIWNEGLCKIAEQYLKKGSQIYLEGQLETRKWTDKDGIEKYSTEVVLRPFRGMLTMLSKAEGTDRGEERTYASERPAPVKRTPGSSKTEIDMDSEIPF